MIYAIIPSYNDNIHLRALLGSLVAQGTGKFKVIVVDDCGKQYASDVVDEFSSFFKVISLRLPANGGPGATRQYGLDYIYKNYTIDDDDYVVFADSDDVFYPYAMATFEREINANHPDVIVAQFEAEDKDKCNMMDKKKYWAWLHGKCYRLKLLQDHDIRFPKVATNEDVVLT